MSAESSSNPTEVISATNNNNKIRRVGRVERWLRKGFGFIIDLGRLNADGDNYGWVKDENSGTKAFVYHDALSSQSQQVFHRLFAHEYVEYDIDTSLPLRDGRYQAFAVSGLFGSKLLCDLNAIDDEEGTAPPPASSSSHQQRARNPRRSTRSVAPVPQAPAQIIYYVPTTGLPSMMPPHATPMTNSEPSYVMPASGIPVPK